MGLAPFRPWHDFFDGSGRFAKPDFGDLTKWNNRVISNLLYYQTNYFVVAIMAFLIIGFLNPLGMFLGGSVMTLVLMAPVWAISKNFIKKNPTLFIIGVMGTSYFSLSLCGGIRIFIFGLTLPLLLILVHASLRRRNLKNRLENKMDGVGLMRSPMGVILDMLDQQEEKMNKIQDFIES